MLEEIIANLIQNRKKYFFAFIFFILAILLVTLGIIKTVFVMCVTILGYNLGKFNFVIKLKKIREFIVQRFDDK